MSKNKNIILAIILVVALIAGWWFFNNRQTTIRFALTNNSDFDRVAELVEVQLSQLDIDAKQFVLLDSAEHELTYQLTATSLLFQADIPAHTTTVYMIKQGVPASPIYKVFARFVPERKDDFAWENDIAAYRMYGPALADENPSNGVDLWLKKTDELIVDTFYYREHELGLPYHIDYGKGLDCYKVGHTMGCGGVALIYDDSLYIGNHYDHWEIIEEGPLRTVFKLNYDSVVIDTFVLQQSLCITVSAGSVVNKAEVVYNGADIDNVQVAAGIFLHADESGVVKSGFPANPFIAYAEHAQSDAGLDVGRNYVGVVMPQAEAAQVKDGSLIAYRPYQIGQTLTYYFGGGWSQWRYATDEDWFRAVERAAKSLNEPLEFQLIEENN